MTAPTAPANPPSDAAVLEYWPPGDLLLAANVRTTPADIERDDPAFVASIRALGLLEPVVGWREAGDDPQAQPPRVILGQRRTLGSVAAARATIPVMVHVIDGDNTAREIARITSQVTENHQRSPLSATDLAGAVDTLFDMWVPADGTTAEGEIAYLLNLDPAEVAAARKLAASKPARAAVAGHQVDLMQAARIAEFTGRRADKDTVGQLLDAAAEGPGTFEHVYAKAVQHRDDKTELDNTVKELRKAKVKVVTTGPGWENQVDRWMPADGGKAFTAESHATCPGHSVTVAWGYGQRDGAYGRRIEVTGFCDDPRKRGHKQARAPRRDDGTGGGGKMTEPEKRARKALIAANREWKAATGVRLAWLAKFAARPKPPKGWRRFLLVAIASSDIGLTDSSGQYAKLAAGWLGIETKDEGYYSHGRQEAVAKLFNAASDDRATVIDMALVFGAYEAQTAYSTWRSPSGTTKRYLLALESFGYTLSDIEQVAVGQRPNPEDAAKGKSGKAGADPGPAVMTGAGPGGGGSDGEDGGGDA